MKTLYSFFLLAMLCTFNLQAGTLSATTDRQQLNPDETLTLSVQYDASTDDEPDTRELEQQFTILSRNTSSNIRIINGDISRATTWYYELAPRKSGTLLIPGFSVNGDTSKAIAVEVGTTSNKSTSQTPQPEQSIYTETTLDKENVFIQQQVIISWRLIYRRNISEPQFLAPQIDGVLVQDLGSHSYKRTGADGNAEGVVEQRYALFPQKSGNIIIPAQQFQVAVETTRRTAMGLLRTGSAPVAFNTDEKSIEVMPAANSTNNANWLPATSLEISQEILGTDQSGGATAGTAFTRVIRIRAEGLSAEQLPPPDMQANGIKVYSEKPELSNKDSQQGITGRREDRAAIIAKQAGKLVLPAITIPWYDVNNNQWQEAFLPEKIINVLPGTATNATDLNNSNTNTFNTNSVDTIPPATSETSESLPLLNTIMSHLWQIITAALCALLFAIIFYIYQLKKRINHTDVNSATSGSKKPLPTITLSNRVGISNMTELREAVVHSDLKKAHQALNNWAKEIKSNGDTLQHPTVHPLLQSLEKYLYGNGAAPDIAALKNLPAQLEKLAAAPDKNREKKSQLDTLYR